MSLDTPARLGILGAGPIGLEAALYARFLGYDVVIYERRDVAANVRPQGQTRMAAPFKSIRTTLGLAAVQAQDESYRPPADDALLTYQEWLDAYLLPLSQTDLLSDHLQLHTTVLKVERVELAPEEMPDDQDAASFRVTSRNKDGTEHTELFDGILDCTGLASPAELATHDCPDSPYFHILGSKASPQPSDFLLTTGYDQIRHIFSILGDRPTLDLYSTPYVTR